MRFSFLFPIIIFLAIFFANNSVRGQSSLDNKLPVRGLCIAAPKPDKVDEFVEFIHQELTPRKVNTLILRVDYNYKYQSHPELRSENPLSKSDVKKMVRASRENDIQLIPQVNLLGHQSWAGELGNLLKEYPEFDETPHVEMPEEYEWPNEDGLYCKSYCPLHPEVHDVVFAIVDEICDVFETGAFHAGMDEVFYIGNEKCPRCAGRDKAELFANEVRRIRNHLARNGRELWIWGDRLIDGKTTGIGMWEASMNNTYRAIDMIPKDVVICDWHYERAEQTAVYFSMKGFQVITCPWDKPEVAKVQLDDMLRFRKQSTDTMKANFRGMMQTVWTDAGKFMEGFKEMKVDEEKGTQTSWHTFDALYEEIGKLEAMKSEVGSKN